MKEKTIEYRVVVDEFGNQHWYNSNCKRHREDGPAVICSNGNVEYW